MRDQIKKKMQQMASQDSNGAPEEDFEPIITTTYEMDGLYFCKVEEIESGLSFEVNAPTEEEGLKRLYLRICCSDVHILRKISETNAFLERMKENIAKIDRRMAKIPVTENSIPDTSLIPNILYVRDRNKFSN